MTYTNGKRSPIGLVGYHIRGFDNVILFDIYMKLCNLLWITG